MPPAGLEPATPTLRVCGSNQLSYKGKNKKICNKVLVVTINSQPSVLGIWLTRFSDEGCNAGTHYMDIPTSSVYVILTTLIRSDSIPLHTVNTFYGALNCMAVQFYTFPAVYLVVLPFRYLIGLPLVNTSSAFRTQPMRKSARMLPSSQSHEVMLEPLPHFRTNLLWSPR